MAASAQIQKVNWWHERLADAMIANPHATLGEIAAALNRTQAWISTVKNSDVFIDYWRQRSAQHSAEVTGAIKAKGFAATELALDQILTKLDTPAAELIPIETLLSVVDTNMKRFGYNPTTSVAPVLNINLGATTPEQLAEARARLRDRSGAIEAEAMPVLAQIRATRGDLASAGPDMPAEKPAVLGPENGHTRDLPNPKDSAGDAE